MYPGSLCVCPCPLGVDKFIGFVMIESFLSSMSLCLGNKKQSDHGLLKCGVVFYLVSGLGHSIEFYIAPMQSTSVHRVMSSLVYQGGHVV